jgi:hypothetical protein
LDRSIGTTCTNVSRYIDEASSKHFKPKTTTETNVIEDVNQMIEAASEHCAFLVGSNKDQTDKVSVIKSGVYIKKLARIQTEVSERFGRQCSKVRKSSHSHSGKLASFKLLWQSKKIHI